jgi:hypothetical protein
MTCHFRERARPTRARDVSRQFASPPAHKFLIVLSRSRSAFRNRVPNAMAENDPGLPTDLGAASNDRPDPDRIDYSSGWRTAPLFTSDERYGARHLSIFLMPPLAFGLLLEIASS